MANEDRRRDRPAGRLAALAGVFCALVMAGAAAAPVDAGAKVPESFFGMNAFSPTENDFESMADSGIETYRLTIFWQAVQREARGPYNWVAVDALMKQVVDAGMKPFPIVYGTPPFVNEDDLEITPPVRSPLHRREWTRFLEAAVDRYRPGGEFWDLHPDLRPVRIRDWQIWNEQNANFYWRPRANPREYARLLKISDRAMEDADPKARIVLGGMYGYPGNGIYAKKFLSRLYAVPGIKRHFEGVAIHPYGGTVGEVVQQLVDARGVMQANGDSGTGLWVTEVGWASDGPKSSRLVVGRKGQAKLLSKTMRVLVRNQERWNLQAAMVFAWRDYATDGVCPWCPFAGMVSRNGKPKPALRAYEKAIRAAR